ncbi:hypothetical protein QQX98_001487 [Neonectria punicea]|uniref:Uncharacterized protein n=1 Tax=Neonectria punicea TaxID=979145 RepID=A0ABR1HP12_9HYPO
MYFGAVTSLSEETCLMHLGEDRAVLVERYKHNVERALDKADYPNSPDLKVLQALNIYVLSSAPTAQAALLGPSSPSSYDPPKPGSYDILLPRNIDDADFGPESCDLPVSKSGPTDVSFFLAMAMGSGFCGGIRRPPFLGLNPETASSIPLPAALPPGLPPLTEDSVLRQARRLESLFVTPFEVSPSSSSPLH